MQTSGSQGDGHWAGGWGRGGMGVRWLGRLKAGWLLVDQDSTSFTVSTFPFISCFQVRKHLLSTYYVQGMLWVLGVEDVGNRGE